MQRFILRPSVQRSIRVSTIKFSYSSHDHSTYDLYKSVAIATTTVLAAQWTYDTLQDTSHLASHPLYCDTQNSEVLSPVSYGSFVYETDPMRIETLIKELRNKVGSENVLSDTDEVESYGQDNWSYHTSSTPYAVVCPNSTEQVQMIIKLCAAARVPVIPYGGGTSLEGHTTSPLRGICINLRQNMNDIITLRKEDMDVTVQPGITWEELNARVKDSNLFFAVDPGPGATIGGMVNTGCSGTNAVRYGTMRQHVLSLTVVTPSGEVIKTAQRARKTSAGYDLTSIYVGSEGTLGIVTEATLRLQALPESTAVAVVPFDTIQNASFAVRQLIQENVQVRCCELLDDWMMRAINDASGFNYAPTPTLFLKFQGSSEQVEHDAKRVQDIVNTYKAQSFTWATDTKEQARLWEARKVALWSAPILREKYTKTAGKAAQLRKDMTDEMEIPTKVWITDVCVPISAFPDEIEATKQDLEQSFLLAPIVGHAGDGNYHVFLLMREGNQEDLKEAKRLNTRMIERAILAGGTSTGEHGVGLGKRQYLTEELGSSSIHIMRQLKRAFDPIGIMNPGKILPDDMLP